MFISPAYAQGAAAPGGGIFEMLLPMVLIFAIFYFLLIRPQQKRMKDHRAKIAAVRRGDQVVTAGGLIGKVTKVTDDEATVEIAEGVRVQVVKGTISDVVTKTEPATGKAANDAGTPGTVEKPKSLLGSLFGGKK